MKFIKLFENFEGGSGERDADINIAISAIKKHYNQDIEFEYGSKRIEPYLELCATYVEIVRFFIKRRLKVDKDTKLFTAPISNLKTPFKELRQYCKNNSKEMRLEYDLGKYSDFTEGVYSDGDSEGGHVEDGRVFIEFQGGHFVELKFKCNTNQGYYSFFEVELCVRDRGHSGYKINWNSLEEKFEIDFGQLRKLLEKADKFAHFEDN